MFNLFYRGVNTVEIESMDYLRMKFWNELHEDLSKEETNFLRNLKKNRGL